MSIEINIPMVDPDYEMGMDARRREPTPLSPPGVSEFEMEQEAFAKRYMAENSIDNCRSCDRYRLPECYLPLFGRCNQAGLFINVTISGDFFVEKQGEIV